jgi:IS5 family transposase
MAGLAILKHTYDLRDEVVCEQRIEDQYYQYSCCDEFLQHRLPLDRSSITRWRHRVGEERLQALLQASLAQRLAVGVADDMTVGSTNHGGEDIAAGPR